jgi:hypothetical protein
MTLIKVSVTRGVTDSMALKHYMDMYKQPLNEESIEAIEKLTEVVADKKSKKDKKNMKKKGKESMSSTAVHQGKKKDKKFLKSIPAGAGLKEVQASV